MVAERTLRAVEPCGCEFWRARGESTHEKRPCIRHAEPPRATFAPITLEGWLPPRELSPNASRALHWGTRTKIKNATLQTVWGAVKQAGWPAQAFIDPPRLLRITMRRKGRAMDLDNAYAIVKALVDGVKWSGALYDDSPRYCCLEVRQEKGEPATVLELYEDGDA